MKTYGGVDVWIHIFLTSTLAGGKWSTSRLGKFTPKERAPVPIGQEAGWAPKPVWTLWSREKISLAPAGNRTSITHPYLSH
jgi:hypothetical protein